MDTDDRTFSQDGDSRIEPEQNLEVNDEQDLDLEDSEVPEADSEQEAEDAIRGSLVQLGFINFDAGALDSASTGAMVSAEKRKHFRREVYVGIRDPEQDVEFLGRVVEGPFHSPHEVSTDSAITRTTVLHPERTKFRPSYYVYGTIEILGQLVENERVIPTPTRPRPYSEIYIFPDDRLQTLLDIEGDLLLGQLMGYDRVEVRTESENKNFLPRNVGVFGTVGSGKSNTTQVLMEGALSAGWAVVVIDVEGEYVRMNEPTDDAFMINLLQNNYSLSPQGIDDFRVYVPISGRSEADSPSQFKVPISGLDLAVITDILEFSEAQVRMFGTITENASRQNRSQRSSGGRMGVLGGFQTTDSSSRPYTLQDLITGLQENNGQVPLYPNIRSGEIATASVLRSKLRQLERSGMLDSQSTSSVPEIPVADLLVEGRLSILDVSETDDRSRNIAIAYTLQSLFDQVIQTARGDAMPSGQERPPVMVVIEEVHTFVSRSTVSKMRAVMDNLQIISRRGRKRWMALSLISQQPGHVPDELFELANTRFIHQLKSSSNLMPVKQTTGGVHEALWTSIPALGPGQCLLTGAVFKNPIFVNIRPARSKRLLTS